MKKLLTLLCLVGPAFSAAQAAEVARVNGQSITSDQLTARMGEQARSGLVPNKKTALDDLIKREAAIQEAKRLKLEQDPVVQERINGVLVGSLIEKKIGPEFEKSNLSETESKNWYARNPEIRTSHIFMALPPDATAEEEQKVTSRLNQIISDIKSGKMSFAEAAQKFSEDPSAAVGGDLDYRMIDRLDPNYYRAALKLGKVGDITGPIRTPFGFHVIRLTGKHSWNEVDHTHVKKIIIEERRQEMVNKYLNDLKSKAHVTID